VEDYDDDCSSFSPPSELSEIRNEISDIKNDTYDIKEKLSGINQWFWIAFVMFLVFAFTFRQDFSIPKILPVTRNYVEGVGDSGEAYRQYGIVYNEDFNGNATYYYNKFGNGRIGLIIYNNSKLSYNFKNALYRVWTLDHKSYELLFKSSDNGGYRSENVVANPGDFIQIDLECPITMPELEKIQGFNIRKQSCPTIRFGYHRLTWIDRIRWFIAGIIRKP